MKITLSTIRILALPALLLLVTGCQMLAPKTPKAPVKAPITYRQEIKRLPGTTLGHDGLQAFYAEGGLFAAGAVLPMPGGMEMLQPLIDWLHANQTLSVAAIVRADGADKAAAQQLAETRKQLLERVFANRGLTGERIEWTVEVGAGAPLELKFQLIDGSSSGEKS